MCTAISYNTDEFYFGRNLDYEFSYGESVVVTPRRFPFNGLEDHYAMIGMAHMCDGFPLYYDGFNEKGLCIAGLNFTDSAVFGSVREGSVNVAQYELIPQILGRCADINEVRKLAKNLNITGERFKADMPAAKLHWMIADKSGAVVLEQTADGLHLYDDPAGVLTNEPTFPAQLAGLNDYMSLSPYPPKNRFSDALPLCAYSRGMGALGLPGDMSSKSRFVRAAFLRANSVCGSGRLPGIMQFFHLLGSVEQQRGAVRMPDGQCEITIYSSCMDPEEGAYLFKTYDDISVRSVNLCGADVAGTRPTAYPVEDSMQIRSLN